MMAARSSVRGPRLVHCSYHKCLTVYFKRVMDGVFNKCLPWSAGYRHFNGDLDAFWAESSGLRVASVNNHCLDLDRLAPFRLTRFIRDPRDLTVSGYFYHRRGAEPWTADPEPTDEKWRFANGAVPQAVKDSGLSYSAYLQSVSEEEGLLAELEFRRAHFESMAAWPVDHPDVLTFRYEDVLGAEQPTFDAIFDHYGFGALERGLGRFFVRRHALRSKSSDPHVRNPSSGQWRSRFTPRVRVVFEESFPGLIERLGYPTE